LKTSTEFGFQNDLEDLRSSADANKNTEGRDKFDKSVPFSGTAPISAAFNTDLKNVGKSKKDIKTCQT
jgi:hypothetical protein